MYTSPTIFDFTRKVTHVKSNLHEFCTCKIDFTYIRYYLAAKIDFTVFPILAAPDLIQIGDTRFMMINQGFLELQADLVQMEETRFMMEIQGCLELQAY